MTRYTFHIALYDLAFLGAIFIGLTFVVLLWFTKTVNRSANRFLALALVTMIVWMTRILAIDIRLETYLPRWHWLPMQFLLALGPLMYFYVLKITNPQHKFSRRDLMHFSPLLLEQAALVLQIRESATTGGTVTYATHSFQQLNPVLQLLIFISVVTYLHLSNKLIQKFYRRLQPVLMDRPLLEFRWLRRLLAATALLWLLWIFCAAINFFGYSNQLGIQVYYPFYIFFVVIVIWTAVAAFLEPQAAVMMQTAAPIKQTVPAELRAKGAWLKRSMETNLYYQDPELSLSSLAEKLNLPPHDLSKLINTVFKKSFNDFINEYRVMEAARKMNDPAHDHVTLLGIAFEAGFNSKTSFNRIFKQMTGKSPTEYKDYLKKERPSYNLGRQPQLELLILSREPLPKWVPLTLNSNYMFKNYVKIAWRNLVKSKVYSSINIIGLAVGMAVALLISLWIYDELNYNKSFANYNHIVQAMQTSTHGNETVTYIYQPIPLAAELRTKYASDFKKVALSSLSQPNILAVGDKKLSKSGMFAQPDLPSIFSLNMLEGTLHCIDDPSSIAINKSLAVALFGNEDPLNKVIRFNNKSNLKVSGVFADFAFNSEFKDVSFLGPWAFYRVDQSWVKNSETNWDNNSFQIYAQLQDYADVNTVGARVKATLTGHKRSGQARCIDTPNGQMAFVQRI